MRTPSRRLAIFSVLSQCGRLHNRDPGQLIACGFMRWLDPFQLITFSRWRRDPLQGVIRVGWWLYWNQHVAFLRLQENSRRFDCRRFTSFASCFNSAFSVFVVVPKKPSTISVQKGVRFPLFWAFLPPVLNYKHGKNLSSRSLKIWFELLFEANPIFPYQSVFWIIFS